MVLGAVTITLSFAIGDVYGTSISSILVGMAGGWLFGRGLGEWEVGL